MSYSVGTRLAVGRHEVEITAALRDDAASGAYLADIDGEGRGVLWLGTTAWADCVAGLLDGKLPGLPVVLDTDRAADVCKVIVSIDRDVQPFDDETWRSLDRATVVDALQRLTETMGAIHEADGWLHGLKRDDLALTADGELVIGAMPRLHINGRPSVEAPWRDLRIVGELAYENFLAEDYPGGHQMASLLQDRQAIADLGITFPGLTQVLAGCVSPYGDLAYSAASDLLVGLGHLALELDRPRAFIVGSASTVGNYIFRKNNQDSCGYIAMQSICGSRKTSVGFFCVADGIGGIQDGEHASRLAVESAAEAFARGWAAYGADALREHPVEFARVVAKVVGQRLALEGEFSPGDNRGGTTFSGLLIAHDRAAVCHVGDSRIVLVRDGKQTLLTHDHTLANILIALGELTESEAEDHELSQRTISRFLSTATEVELDRIDNFGPAARARLGDEILARGMQVLPGDLFILTSDGAHGETTREEMDALLEELGPNPQMLCDAVVENALGKIGRDNSTMLAVLVEET